MLLDKNIDCSKVSFKEPRSALRDDLSKVSFLTVFPTDILHLESRPFAFEAFENCDSRAVHGAADSKKVCHVTCSLSISLVIQLLHVVRELHIVEELTGCNSFMICNFMIYNGQMIIRFVSITHL